MEFDISKIEFSRKDIFNKIKIPRIMTEELAYLIGIHVGDGTMNIYPRKDCNSYDYKISYAGHIIDEREFHEKIITNLFVNLFNKKVKSRLDERKGHSCLSTYLTSKAILTFFHHAIGLPLGPKKDIRIPEIIEISNIEIKKAFLKGLADTEFCLSFKKRYRQKHYYPVIKFDTQSKNLQKSVVSILKEIGFNYYYISDYQRFRKDKEYFIHMTDLNGLDNLDIWMKEISFNSTKHLTKYEVWKKFGFCPPKTNIIERQKILKGEIDINSYYDPVA